MSRDVSLQTDVGSLSLQGLGAVTSVLATLSTDNVAPMALLQMEQLGSVFHVNGQYAEDVKGLLQRCSDVRLDRLALTIGWRKNDSASLMAQSAGGQSIALIAMCLTTLLGRWNTGKALIRLCSDLCPQSANIASISQLADVAELLSAKVKALAFGNLLAKETLRIHNVIDSLNINLEPGILLEPISDEIIVELLEKASEAFRGENEVCRISGCHGMGHIVALLQALFPRVTSLTVDGVVIQSMETPKIRCEVILEPLLHVRIELETVLSHTMPVKLPISGPTNAVNVGRWMELGYHFTWSGWLVNCLELVFTEFRCKWDRKILQTICNLLVLLPVDVDSGRNLLNIPFTRKSHLSLFHHGESSLLALLGPLPHARMSSICSEILECTPTEQPRALKTTFQSFVRTMEELTLVVDCSCSQCSWSDGWYHENFSCSKGYLWHLLGNILKMGFWSFFIDASPNTTVSPAFYHYTHADIVLPGLRQAGVKIDHLSVMTIEHLLGFCGPQHNNGSMMTEVARSSMSCTVYPSILTDLRLPPRRILSFALVDGRIIYKNRYHTNISTPKGQFRFAAASQSLVDGPISPSHIGCSTGNPVVTIGEEPATLLLNCTVFYGGSERGVNLRDVLEGYINLKWTTECPHSPTTPLDTAKYPAFATSVGSPWYDKHFGVAMTRYDPVSQFFCCSIEYQSIVQQDCCLNCAAKALQADNGVIIVR